MQLYVELRCLSQGCLNATDFSDLTSDMEMDKFQTVHAVVTTQELQRLQQITRIQSELTGITATLFPFTGARRGQLDTNTNVRTHMEHLGRGKDGFQLLDFFNHNENTLAHLLSQQSHLDVIAVLVPVADNQTI